MNLHGQVVNPTLYKGWDDMVLSMKGYSFFHSSAWAKTLCETYKYEPTYFLFRWGEEVAGLFPFMDVKSFLTGHRGISLPFTDNSEPLTNSNLQFEDALDYIITYGRRRGWRFLELRGGQQLLTDAPPSKIYWGHTLSLSPDENEILSGLKDSTRRNVKKAMKEGVEVRILRSLESINEFYTLNCITRKRHGLPPQPYRFFKKVYQHIILKGMGFVVLAYFLGKVVAGNIYFHFGEKAIFKYGASDVRYQGLRPSDIVMWEAIKWFCQKGYKELHFGRTDYDHQGLRQFKTGWGTEEQKISYLKYDMDSSRFIEERPKVKEVSEKILSMLPVPVLRLTGSMLYRHFA